MPQTERRALRPLIKRPPPRPADGGTMDEARVMEALDPDKPYLGDPVVIDAMLRGYAAKVMDIAGSDMDDAAAMIAVDRAAEPVAQALLGQDLQYTPIPVWNAPDGGLPRNITRRWGLTGSPQDLVKGQLHLLALDMMSAADEAHEGQDFVDSVEASLGLHQAVVLGIDTVLYPQ